MRRILSVLPFFIFALIPVFCAEVAKYDFNYFVDFGEPEYSRVYFSDNQNGSDKALSEYDLKMNGDHAEGVQYYIIVESNEVGKTISLSLTPGAFHVYKENNEIDTRYGSINHTVRALHPTNGEVIDISSAVKTSIGEVTPTEDVHFFVYPVSYIIDEESYAKAAAGKYISNVTVEWTVNG